MVRFARVVAPGTPHHVTQRGNRRQQVSFGDEDVRAYVEFLAPWCKAYKGWHLMPSHAHLILAPPDDSALRLAASKAHKHTSRRVNVRGQRETRDGAAFLAARLSDESLALLRPHERTRRPLGSQRFVERAGDLLGGDFAPKKRAPSPERARVQHDATPTGRRCVWCFETDSHARWSRPKEKEPRTE